MGLQMALLILGALQKGVMLEEQSHGVYQGHWGGKRVKLAAILRT